MKKVKIISLTASMVLAMVFIFSCSGGDDPPPPNEPPEPSSSSSSDAFQPPLPLSSSSGSNENSSSSSLVYSCQLSIGCIKTRLEDCLSIGGSVVAVCQEPSSSSSSDDLQPPLSSSSSSDEMPSSSSSSSDDFQPSLSSSSSIDANLYSCQSPIGCIETTIDGCLLISGSIVTVCPVFACTMTATTGTVGVAISPVPTVRCNGSTVTTNLMWTPWDRIPTTAGSVSVSVSTYYDYSACRDMTAQCGNITVSAPVFTCTMTATTGTVGVAISPVPTVRCNGSTVSTIGLTWTPTNRTPTTAGSVSVSVSGSGVCSGMTAQCGSITVSLPSSSSVVPSSSSALPSSSSVAPSSSSVAPPSVISGTFLDERNGYYKYYKWVKIGTQTWMAQNLNYPLVESECYGKDEDNCYTYGRLYNWSVAMRCYNSSSCSEVQPKHQGICPEGWHIPSIEDWDILMDYVGGYLTAGTKLKATSGWNDYHGASGNGTDEYGFSALPGGTGISGGSLSTFRSVGDGGLWWSASALGSISAYAWYIYYDRDYAGRSNSDKNDLYSVRCLQD